MTPRYSDAIEILEIKLKHATDAYLRAYGWKSTSNTPGSFWLWTRDFADVDEKRAAFTGPKASPAKPYGVITAETEMAVMMTRRVLEPPAEDEGE